MNRFSPGSRNNKERLDHAERLLAAGRHAVQADDLDEALAFLQEAFLIKAGLLGLEHTGTISIAEEIGEFSHHLDKMDETIGFFQREIDKITDPNDPRLPLLANLIERIGNIYNSHDSLSEAGAMYALALASVERARGQEDRPIVFLLQKMVGIQYNLGDLAAAQELTERVLALDERVFGSQHPKVAADLSSLGGILRASGKLEAARAAYERAITIE